MSRRSRAALVAGVLLIAGCAHTRQVTPATGWRTLAAPARPFVALYDLDCCGRRGLLCTVRASDDELELSVVARPGAAVLRVWAEPAGSWLLDAETGCRVALPEGVVPLGDDLELPVSPAVLHAILAGVIPPDGREVPAGSGWVEGAVGAWRWRVLPVGDPVRLGRFDVLGGTGAQETVLKCELDQPRLGTIPGRIRLRLGNRSAELGLRSFSWSEAVARPSWLESPLCAAAR